MLSIATNGANALYEKRSVSCYLLALINGGLCNVATVLSQALESTHPLATVRTVRKLQHEHLERKLAEVKEIASRRSGARGAKARKELIAAEVKVAESGLS